MRILAIDTVTEMCSVALSVDGEMIERHEMAVNRHSQIVLEMINAVLDEAGLRLAQLDLIVDDIGPGSFTGIRIGMGVTQGLAYALDLPVLGVDALSCLAQGALEDSEGAILAAMDARMKQIYWAWFEPDTSQPGHIKLQGELQLGDPHQLTGIARPVYGCGSGWDSYGDILKNRCKVLAHASGRFPMAENALQLGMQVPKSRWRSAAELEPLYLRNDVAKVSRR